MNMKKVSLDTWIQLIGMLSVLAGLVFVGLEMQQNQRIALAAQQTARVEIFSEIVNSLTESGVQYYAGLSPVEEFDPQLNVTHQLLWIFENDFLQYSLGLMYNNGLGVKQDYKESAKWYRRSVEQGHTEAQYNLGVMYGNGNGVKQDDVYAHMWFDIVASKGDENGALNRNMVAMRMTKEQLLEAQKLARACVKKK